MVDLEDAGTTVIVLDGATQIGTAKVQADGTWTTSITLSGAGTHTLTATDTDAAGNVGSSNSIAVTLSDQNEAPAFSAINEITLVSTAAGGYEPTISADGRYVAFTGPPVGWESVFVRDLQTGDVTLVSANLGSNSYSPSISADGRYVAFQNSAAGAYVADVQTGALTLINSLADFPSISADGHYVAFYSAAGLVPEDTNNKTDVFVQDLQSGDITCVSADDAYVYQANVHAGISADGRYVTFIGGAPDLMTGDPNGRYALFVRDLQTGDITRVSTFAGQNVLDVDLDPSISADGRYVAFANGAVGGVWDLQTGDIISVLADSYSPSISADGRYVVFYSYASNLVPGDTNNTADVFVQDLHTGAITRLSTGVNGNQGNDISYDPSITDNVFEVSFETTRSGLPSPFTSPIATPKGETPAGIMIGLPNVPLPLPSSTDTVLDQIFATATSGMPSPFKSPAATENPPASDVLVISGLNVPSPLPSSTDSVSNP
jgi:Tol biopolymer transport system component